MSRSLATEDDATRRSVAQLDPLPSALLDEPLDFIFADHFRQRSLCAVLRKFAGNRRASRASAEKVVAFLAHDLPLHHQDEDAELFPAMLERAEPDDGLPPILAGLSADHRLAAPLIDEIIVALSVADDPITVPVAAADTMFTYATAEQRHLSIENGIVLVLARKRLKHTDLAAMSVAMKARRLRVC